MLLLVLACGSQSEESAAHLRAVTSAEVPLEEAWRRFEAAIAVSDWSAARTAGREAAAAAARARDFLEKQSVPPRLANARREELLFVNHAVLAYQDFAVRDGTAVDLAKLKSILRRGRIQPEPRPRDSPP